jgi:hypothetical protein
MRAWYHIGITAEQAIARGILFAGNPEPCSGRSCASMTRSAASAT